MVSVQGCRYKQKAEGIFVLPLSNNLRYTLVTSLDEVKVLRKIKPHFLLIARCHLEPQNAILFKLSFALFPVRHEHGKEGVELFGVIGMNQVA